MLEAIPHTKVQEQSSNNAFLLPSHKHKYHLQKKKNICGRGRTLLGEERIVYYSDQDRE